MSRQRGRRGQHVLAVVENEQQRSRRENVDHRFDEVLRRQGAHVERSCDRLRNQPCLRESARARRAPRPPRTTASALRASSSASRVLPAPPVPDSVRRRVRRSSDFSSVSSWPRPMNELASAGQPERPRGAEGGDLLLELGCERRELVATRLCPVVVAVLRQELAAVERERRPVGGRSLDPARVRRPRARTGRRRSSAVRERTSSRSSIASASSARRATCTAWWRLFAAAAGPRSRQSTSIACSRCSRWPGASASSFTSSRAFFSRQAAGGDADAVHFGCESTEEPEVDIAHFDDNLDAAWLQGHSRLACPLGRARGYRT